MRTLTESIKSIQIEKSDDNWKLEKTSPHSMHKMCSRICSFPPALPSYFIRKYTKKGDIVFDGWSGKGTVPFEALRNGRIGIGNDKSPEAFVVTHAKLNPVSLNSLQRYLQELKAKMEKIRVSKDLTELDRKAKIFYSNKTFDQVVRLKEVLMEEESDAAMFVKGIVLGLLHGNSINSFSLRCSHSYSMSPKYVKRYAKEHHLRRPTRDVLECILEKAKQLLSNPIPDIRGVALNNDSRSLGLESESIHMVLTSPPYFDVQTYAWCNWLRLWVLGHDYRVVRKTLAESGLEAKYKEFMKDSIEELYRVLAPDSRCFIVVGDVKRPVKGGFVTINTAEFLLPLLLDAGFTLDKILVDAIPPSKRVMSYIKEGDGIKIERILCLEK